ncbi:hypothetical protein [Candidatus Pantoea floridensis]|uniref:Uncharacterized protein n=1 Tax=Candidatus Pantoea floridensis TaxID=1938870 RepID=A0A286DSR5_9GAMM|nr:hypothetical protein [Pantoea floridensis]PIF06759.1 hypothetical protein BX596_5250 [Enterobacteriaceae bacterium JKS000233]SOD61699.1 hypothetical protein SAMN06273570_5255 [Pantoea floridensis]
MSDRALMFFKPEFTPEDRARYFPVIRHYLDAYGLSIEDDCEVHARDEKEVIFERVYERLLKNARQPQSGKVIGGFSYLEMATGADEKQLFQEWISPLNPALRTGEDNYYLQKDDLRVVNPFCPHQRRLFIESRGSAHLFLIRRNGALSWSETKPLFQGAPVQTGGQGRGIRSHLSQCRWYTPTTNGLHLSASDHDALRETQAVMEFFTDSRQQRL